MDRDSPPSRFADFPAAGIVPPSHDSTRALLAEYRPWRKLRLMVTSKQGKEIIYHISPGLAEKLAKKGI